MTRNMPLACRILRQHDAPCGESADIAIPVTAKRHLRRNWVYSRSCSCFSPLSSSPSRRLASEPAGRAWTSSPFLASKIAITAPPLSDPSWASNARAFNQWLVSQWLAGYAYHNVAVFDFYNVLTTNGGDPDTNDLGSDSGNHHRLWGGALGGAAFAPLWTGRSRRASSPSSIARVT